MFSRLKQWLGRLSFRTGVIVLLCCIPCYILSFAQMALPISVELKGVLWFILFGMAKTYQCENCKLRANYEKNPKSLLGRFWRWHINFCPGWKAYFTSLDAEAQQALRSKYDFNKY